MHTASDKRFTMLPQKTLIGSGLLLVAMMSFVILVLPFQSPSELRHALHILRFGGLPALPPHTHCVIYDKTPRTGSSTVSGALRNCLQSSLKFSFPIITKEIAYDRMISHTLNWTSDRVALAGSHFKMPPEEIIQLRRSCRWMFYITSTRTMTERIASRAKSFVSSGKTYMNTSLSTTQMKEAWDRAIKMIDEGEDEKRMERYPFDGWVLSPDYIIRSDFFGGDLSDLLQAFNCSGSFYSKNMHALEDDNSTERNEDSWDKEDDSEDDSASLDIDENETLVDFDNLPIRLGDTRHKRLALFAEKQNERGLEKAAEMINALDIVESRWRQRVWA